MEAVAMQVDLRDAEDDSSAELQRAAAAGDTAALQCAMSRWIASLHGLPKKATSKRATTDLLAALSAACQTDSSECVRDLIHATGALTRCYDCAPAALAASAAAGSTRALAVALAAPELSRFLDSNGPDGPSRLAGAVAEALSSVLARGPAPTTSDEACLQLLLASLASPSSPVAAARAALAPHAPGLLAAAAASDMRGALQALLVWLPDWAAALDACAADAARRAGRHSLADDIDYLLSLRAPCMGDCMGMEAHAQAHAPAILSAGPAAPLTPALQALALSGPESSQPWSAHGGCPAPAEVALPGWDGAGSGGDSPCTSPHTACKAAPVVGRDNMMRGADEEEALGSPSCSSSSSSSGGSPAASAWGVASPAAASAAHAAAEISSGGHNNPCTTSPQGVYAETPPAAAAARRVRAALLAGSPRAAAAAARAAALPVDEIELLIGALLSAPPSDLLREAEAAVSDCESINTAAGDGAAAAQSGLGNSAQRNAVAALPVHVAEFWAAFQSEPSEV